jgi:hypothetical protein
MASARSTAWMTAAGASAPSGSIPTPPNRDPGSATVDSPRVTDPSAW